VVNHRVLLFLQSLEAVLKHHLQVHLKKTDLGSRTCATFLQRCATRLITSLFVISEISMCLLNKVAEALGRDQSLHKLTPLELLHVALEVKNVARVHH
jgi:hypothetical protein